MAKGIKARVNTATFEWKENSIDLRAEFQNMEALSEAVGQDAVSYIYALANPRELCEVFYHLQHETDYERNLIWDAFMASSADFFNTDFQKELAVAITVLLGGDKAKILDELAKLNADEENTQKKSAE